MVDVSETGRHAWWEYYRNPPDPGSYAERVRQIRAGAPISPLLGVVSGRAPELLDELLDATLLDLIREADERGGS